MGAGSEREVLAQRLRDMFTPDQDVREMPMFGGLSFMVNDRMAVAARTNGDLLVRVGPAAYDELLQRGAMPAFMGTGRPMGRAWMSIPQEETEDAADLTFWVELGVASRNIRT